jgi:hypothetical protein
MWAIREIFSSQGRGNSRKKIPLRETTHVKKSSQGQLTNKFRRTGQLTKKIRFRGVNSPKISSHGGKSPKDFVSWDNLPFHGGQLNVSWGTSSSRGHKPYQGQLVTSNLIWPREGLYIMHRQIPERLYYLNKDGLILSLSSNWTLYSLVSTRTLQLLRMQQN